MKNVYFILITLGMFIISCRNNPSFHEVKVNNPLYFGNTVFSSFEDYSSPKVRAFKDKYQLDTVFHGEQDEYKRILLLRNWVSNTIRISDFEEDYPGAGYAEGILDHAIIGHGYHCGHYMIVQNAVMNAYGYITRCIGAGPGVKGGPDWHHGSNEIWSNTYQKWFLSDAKYNHQFERNDIPLSALEIREEFLKNGAADIVLKKGTGRITIDYDSLKNASGKFEIWTKKRFAQAYTWIEFEKQNDRFTNWPQNSDNLNIFNLYADDYSKSHTWIWDGKPHWAYNTKFMTLVGDRQAIEWTPNTISANVNIHSKNVHIDLTSNTPNLRAYQLKEEATGEWKDVTASLDMKLDKDRHEFNFRTINLAGVTGPEYSVIIER